MSSAPPEHHPAWPTLPRKKRPATRRIAARVAYAGAGFSGFQQQPGRRTVEGELSRVLAELGFGGLAFASRTDAGVHAEGQVIVFRVPAVQEPLTVGAALAERFPPDIRMSGVSWAPARFHPRWSALGKEYLYRVPESTGECSWERLQAAGEELARCPALNGFTGPGAPDRPAPPLESLVIERRGSDIALRFRGPAFRRYAIRNMVGCVWQQARGELPPGSCTAGAATPPPYRGLRAPAEGLTLIKVFYPPELDPFPEAGA